MSRVKSSRWFFPSKFMFVYFVMIVALLGTVLGTLTFASPNVNKSGKLNGSIIFSENPVPAGTNYKITGSGFRANTWVTVGVDYSPTDTVYWHSGISDSNGTITLDMPARYPGNIPHKAYEQTNSGMRLKAANTITIHP